MENRIDTAIEYLIDLKKHNAVVTQIEIDFSMRDANPDDEEFLEHINVKVRDGRFEMIIYGEGIDFSERQQTDKPSNNDETRH